MTTFSKRTLLTALAALPLTALFAPQALADIEVNVNRGDVQPLPIALPAFGGGQVGADIAGVITNNLQRSGLFRPLDPASFIDRDLNAAVQPNYPAWQKINAQALLYGQASTVDGHLQADFRLCDVFQEKELLGKRLASSPENWRRVAHQISDAVYERLTGEKGYFDTRVVFVAESGGRGSKVKRLAIMDQDGANPSYLTDGSGTIMTPRFSSNSQEITYMELRPEGSKIYILNLETTRRESLGDFARAWCSPRASRRTAAAWPSRWSAAATATSLSWT